jgi:hypothetical protein
VGLKGLLVRILTALALTLCMGSCAKFPATGGGQNTHLIFTMTVAGHIRDGSTGSETPYIYLVAVNPSTDSNPTETGPISVITQPWGNGLLAGHATHFIRYGLDQPAPYGVYQFTAPDLLAFGLTGAPVNSTNPNGGATIQFEIDLSQITPNGVLPENLLSVQINFMTMNRRPLGNDSGSKIWDALGDGRVPGTVNDFILIPLTTSRIYTNADFQDIEVPGDTPDPDLDIISWSVEVRRP